MIKYSIVCLLFLSIQNFEIMSWKLIKWDDQTYGTELIRHPVYKYVYIYPDSDISFDSKGGIGSDISDWYLRRHTRERSVIWLLEHNNIIICWNSI